MDIDISVIIFTVVQLWVNKMWSQAASIIPTEGVQAVKSRSSYGLSRHGPNRPTVEVCEEEHQIFALKCLLNCFRAQCIAGEG